MEKIRQIEKVLKQLIKIDAGAGPGTQRLIDRILKDIMDGKRGLTFDPKQGKLVWFRIPTRKEDIFMAPQFAEAIEIMEKFKKTLDPVFKEIAEDPKLGPDVAKKLKGIIYENLFGT